MKKYIFLFAVLGMIFSQSAFAWVDTDKLCEHETDWLIHPYPSISVYYPERKTYIADVWKWYIDEYATSSSDTSDKKLFYVVNIYDTTGKYIEKWLLYEYNCFTKIPKQLKAFSSINQSQNENERYNYFSIRSISNGYILIWEWYAEHSDMGLSGFYVYWLKEKRQMFPMIKIDVVWWSEDVFYSYIYKSANNWYYVEVSYPIIPPLARSSEPYITLYKIDPKTRKITKL